MSASGQTRRFRDVRARSGLPQTADISGPGQHFAFVPLADMTAPLPIRYYRDRRFAVVTLPEKRNPCRNTSI
jgi:hypothetical protein